MLFRSGSGKIGYQNCILICRPSCHFYLTTFTVHTILHPSTYPTSDTFFIPHRLSTMSTQKQNALNGKSKSSGTSTPVSNADKKEATDALSVFASGKPDKKVYDAEQDKIKAEIDALQVKLASPPLLRFPSPSNGPPSPPSRKR